MAKPSTRRSIAVYAASAILLLTLNILRTSSGQEDMRFGVFVKSRCVASTNSGSMIDHMSELGQETPLLS
jgi:hypothetical protein